MAEERSIGLGDLDALSRLDDPVRRRLYEWVAEHDEPVTRDEAAAAAGIGRTLAAYHLDKLADQGLLTVSFGRPPGRRGPGAGRPAKLYSPSGRSFSVNVPPRDFELAARVLAEAAARDRTGALRKAAVRAAREHGREAGRHADTGGASRGTRALRRLEKILRDRGYDPFVDEEGVLRLRNCPFHPLSREHKDLVCGMNEALIQGLVQEAGVEGIRARLDPQPGRCCVAISAGS
jgi:predicted ArsR family transcriptional regulator